MSENIIQTESSTIIINGGDPLPGCPSSYEEANSWADEVNKDKSSSEPRWSFDCGFKLDFDGPILKVSSRFYPPKSHYGPKWHGTVAILFRGNEILSKEFEEDTLELLKVKVETYVNTLCKSLGKFIDGN